MRVFIYTEHEDLVSDIPERFIRYQANDWSYLTAVNYLCDIQPLPAQLNIGAIIIRMILKLYHLDLVL